MSNCVAHPYGELYIILLAQKRKRRAIYYPQQKKKRKKKRLKARKYSIKVDALFPIIHY